MPALRKSFAAAALCAAATTSKTATTGAKFLRRGDEEKKPRAHEVVQEDGTLEDGSNFKDTKLDPVSDLGGKIYARTHSRQQEQTTLLRHAQENVLPGGAHSMDLLTGEDGILGANEKIHKRMDDMPSMTATPNLRDKHEARLAALTAEQTAAKEDGTPFDPKKQREMRRLAKDLDDHEAREAGNTDPSQQRNCWIGHMHKDYHLHAAMLKPMDADFLQKRVSQDQREQIQHQLQMAMQGGAAARGASVQGAQNGPMCITGAGVPPSVFKLGPPATWDASKAVLAEPICQGFDPRDHPVIEFGFQFEGQRLPRGERSKSNGFLHHDGHNGWRQGADAASAMLCVRVEERVEGDALGHKKNESRITNAEKQAMHKRELESLRAQQAALRKELGLLMKLNDTRMYLNAGVEAVLVGLEGDLAKAMNLRRVKVTSVPAGRLDGDYDVLFATQLNKKTGEGVYGEEDKGRFNAKNLVTTQQRRNLVVEELAALAERAHQLTRPGGWHPHPDVLDWQDGQAAVRQLRESKTATAERGAQYLNVFVGEGRRSFLGAEYFEAKESRCPETRFWYGGDTGVALRQRGDVCEREVPGADFGVRVTAQGHQELWMAADGVRDMLLNKAARVGEQCARAAGVSPLALSGAALAGAARATEWLGVGAAKGDGLEMRSIGHLQLEQDLLAGANGDGETDKVKRLNKGDFIEAVQHPETEVWWAAADLLDGSAVEGADWLQQESKALDPAQISCQSGPQGGMTLAQVFKQEERQKNTKNKSSSPKLQLKVRLPDPKSVKIEFFSPRSERSEMLQEAIWRMKAKVVAEEFGGDDEAFDEAGGMTDIIFKRIEAMGGVGELLRQEMAREKRVL